MQFLVKSSIRFPTYGFCTAKATHAHRDIAGANFFKFQQKYQEYVVQFNQKLEQIEKDQKVTITPPTGKAYHHPYDNPHNPINFSGIKSAELFYNFIGPEQVSAHYENFLVARKYLILTYAGLIAIGFAAGTTNLHWMAKSSFIPFLFWMQIMYFYLEGRKSFMKPLLARFYRRVAENEIFQLDEYYHENMEQKIRSLLSQAKGQIEYGFLHKEYRDVKAELINTFLMNEHQLVQKNIQDRTINILKQAQQYEQINQNKLISEIIEAALKSLDTAMTTNKEEIQKGIFQSALKGIAKGEMTYENDPLMQLVLKTIRDHVQKIQNLTPEQQLKLISLTTEQLESIRNSDKRAKQEFLQAEPKVDQSIKNYDSVKKQLATWGQ